MAGSSPGRRFTSSRRVPREPRADRRPARGAGPSRQAREFLDAARAALDAGWRNAAASSAVSAGINAKDALCVAVAGRATAADDHSSAVAELRSLGAAGVDPGNALDRLLGLEDRAQYDRRSVGPADAQAAVRRAVTLVAAAETALRN